MHIFTNIIKTQIIKLLGSLNSDRFAMIAAGVVVSGLIGFGDMIDVDLNDKQITGLTGIIALFVAGIISNGIRPIAPRDSTGRPQLPKDW